MTGLIYLTYLVVIQGGPAAGVVVSQLYSTVRVQPGHSTSFVCHIQPDGRFSMFWIKNPLNKAPVCIATAKSLSNDVTTCEQFKNESRIKVTWNQKTFNLSFSSVEPSDAATYFCGMHSYGHLYFGNGSKLILEEHAVVVSPKTPIKDNNITDGKIHYEYLTPVLAASNVVSILFMICLCHRLKKKRWGGTGEESPAIDKKTEEVNYAALHFANKQRRTKQKRTDVDTTVVYGAVRHQEEL